jgi:decaprenylphospho-beta-D-ribofuranose 2-oxidase
MSIELEDLIGLNKTRVAGMPIVESQAVAQQIVAATKTGKSLAMAGMRHSQGGHTALQDGQVMLTETMRSVSYDPATQTVTAGGGATWSQIHQVLQANRRATLVQQSSAHFTVGGSLAVNCHGRDPSQGPLSNTVVSIKVLCGDGKVLTATPAQEKDLFKAVIGGYGCCGLILQATFRTTANLPLQVIWRSQLSINEYLRKSLALLPKRIPPNAPPPAPVTDLVELHYGWLCCLEGDRFLNEVLCTDYVVNKNASVDPEQFPLKDEGWGMGEILRASWAAAKSDADFKEYLWNELNSNDSITRLRFADWRLNWMRAEVSFSATRGGPVGQAGDSVEILQEYFVPLEKFEAMLDAIRIALKPGNAAGIALLTSTVRLVQKDEVATALAYAGGSKMVCIALDATVPLDQTTGKRAPTQEVTKVFRALIDQAIALKGTFYLPYYCFATPDQFKAAYPGGSTKLLAAISTYDPHKKFWNEFLEAYLG